MRKIYYMTVMTLVIALVSVAAVAADLSPSEIINQPDQYNRQEITVSGVVEDFRAKTSHRGNAYEAFKLCDNKECLDVFAWGSTPRNDGTKIKVSGRFWEIKHVGKYTFYNELDLDNGS
ncbi:MAG: hypothetical protein ACRDF4_02275 [Rhabdochlamydiaceae bacterium]